MDLITAKVTYTEQNEQQSHSSKIFQSNFECLQLFFSFKKDKVG